MSGRPHRTSTPLPRDATSKRRTWRFYAAIAIAAIALIFILQNSQDVEVDVIFATTSAPLFFILLITFLAGSTVGWLLPKVRGRRRDKNEK